MRKAIALIFSLLVMAVLFIIGQSFFTQTLNGSNLVKRYVTSLRAFWAAESGISKGIEKLKECAQSGDCQVSGTIDYENESYSYFATISVLDSLNYRVDSSGSLGQITKNISAVVRLRDIDANNFPYAIESQGINGDAKITGGEFEGIIYVIGELKVPAGNPTVEGTILVEGDPSETTSLRGNFELDYDIEAIDEALNNLRYVAPQTVAWWQTY